MLTGLPVRALAIALMGLAWACPTPGAEGLAPTEFGFRGPEIFPIDLGIAHLRSADLNQDGLNDLIVANNDRSKITLLINQTGHTPDPKKASSTSGINELPPDARFRIESIASEKRISSLVVADLNGDTRPDLAYYGDPKELVVHYSDGAGGWEAPKRWAIDDGELSPNALTARDVNGDGRADLMLLAETHLYQLRQNEHGQFGEPDRLPFSGQVKSVQALDIDGDRLNDLLLVNWDDTNPFRFRLQNKEGFLGPEYHFATPPIRSYWAEDLDGDGKTEVVTIAMKSGRVQISNFVRKEAESILDGLASGQFQVLPLSRTTKVRRGICWADLNGDDRTDLLVAEPDSGQLSVFLQDASGNLTLSKTVPSLTGVTDIAVRRGDRKVQEIVLLSAEERQVGVTRYEKDGRIPFPTPLPVEGKPLVLAVGSLDGKETTTLAVVTELNNQRQLWIQTEDGESKTVPMAESFRSNPAAMGFHDTDQDGRVDLVILMPYEKVKVLRQTDDLVFEELDVSAPGGSLESPWMSRADVDGDKKPELLLGQKNFVRAVILEKGNEAWNFRVADQINGASSGSRITAATPVPHGRGGVPLVALMDAERKVLSLCRRDDDGVWQIERNVSLPYADFQGLDTIRLGKSRQGTVAFVGLNAVAWQSFEGDAWEVAELGSYETSIEDGRLFDVVSGDLNQDGRQDLVFLETEKNHLDLVIFDRDGKLVPATRWPVFEKRSFRNRRGTDQMEPREALVKDLTGDGRNDLAVLVHDRVLVYPQD